MDKTAKEITSDLGKAYREWKDGEKKKDTYRKAFFELANESLEGEAALSSARIYGPSQDEAIDRAAKQLPTWVVKEMRPAEDGWFEAVIEENPEYRPYTYVNSDDGNVYTRQVQAGPVNIDDERLQAEDPELYEAVTHIPQERKLKPIEELDPYDAAKLQPYLYEGKPKVRLAPPRKAKPEELPVDA